jgi:hypothetical protein
VLHLPGEILHASGTIFKLMPSLVPLPNALAEDSERAQEGDYAAVDHIFEELVLDQHMPGLVYGRLSAGEKLRHGHGHGSLLGL